LLPKAQTQCTEPRENVILEKAFLNLKQFLEMKAFFLTNMTIANAGGFEADFAAFAEKFKKCLENEPKTFLSSEWSGRGAMANGCGFGCSQRHLKFLIENFQCKILNVLDDSDSFERNQDGKTYLAG
jgi:hypothetical protein